jgi:archaetidylinositol phosphate synthase
MELSRIHESWFAKKEKQLLIAIAAKLPPSITPDHLTLLGLLGAVLTGISYIACNYSANYLWLASLGFIINWFGDSLDGTLSRYRKIERPIYGFFIDHNTDVFAQLFIFMGLGLSPFMHFNIACIALLSYWIASLYTFIRAIATNQFQISYGGFGPTEIRLSLIVYNFLLFFVGPLPIETPYFGQVMFINFIIIPIFIVVFISFLSLVWIEGRRLAKLGN